MNNLRRTLFPTPLSCKSWAYGLLISDPNADMPWFSPWLVSSIGTIDSVDAMILLSNVVWLSCGYLQTEMILGL